MTIKEMGRETEVDAVPDHEPELDRQGRLQHGEAEITQRIERVR